jgi:GH25 family lysozyme M1 (1,4-beta-N-acetylmuramidase)
MTLAGIDVSAIGQGASFDWTLDKGKLGFAFAKITQGMTIADPDAARNIAQMRAEGITPGGYHFLSNLTDPDGGAPQAEYFLRHAEAAGLKPGDLIALDVEDGGLCGLSAGHMDLVAAGFLGELKKHYGPGFNAIVYTEISMAPSLVHCGASPLWLANPSGTKVTSVGPWKAVSFEQTGQRYIDTDVFYGTAAELAKLAIPR